MRRPLFSLFIALCAFLVAQVSSAIDLDLSFVDPAGEIGFAVGLDSSETGDLTENPDGTLSWVGEFIDTGTGAEFEWDLHLDPDPFIAGVVAVRNNTGMDGDFNFQVGMPIAVNLPAGSPTFGSSAITINDANNSGGATLSAPAGGSIYTGGVDGTTVATLYDDPYSLSPAFPPTTNIDNASYSGVTANAFSVGDIMTLRHSLHLSAGDSATANSNFAIIPEPASLVLLGIAGLAALAIGRRQSR